MNKQLFPSLILLSAMVLTLSACASTGIIAAFTNSTPTPRTLVQPVATWNTFNSPNYHYAILYPAGWSVSLENAGTIGEAQQVERVIFTQTNTGSPDQSSTVTIEAAQHGYATTGQCQNPTEVVPGIKGCRRSLRQAQTPVQEVIWFQPPSPDAAQPYFYVQFTADTAQAVATFNQMLATFTYTGSAQACQYQAELVADVTIPDNTVMAPGAAFTKTWRVRNESTCTWGPELTTVHALQFIYGAQLSALNEVPLAHSVPPGSTFDMSIEMIAPKEPGLYRSEWLFLVANGPMLGVSADKQTPLAAQIIVGPADTPAAWQTYSSPAGLFSIRHRAADAFYENKIPSVDGVMAPVSNTIAIRTSTPDPVILSITSKPIEPGTAVETFAAQDDACAAQSLPVEPVEISGQKALMFKDTLCGPIGATVIYAARGTRGYRIAIASAAPYDLVKGWITPVLDTIHWLDSSSTAPALFAPIHFARLADVDLTSSVRRSGRGQAEAGAFARGNLCFEKSV